MIVTYRTNKLEEVCTILEEAKAHYGVASGRKLLQRIQALQRAPNVEYLIQNKIGRRHPLHGDREDQYAMDLEHPYRLVFEKKGDAIQIAFVSEIVDYHHKRRKK